MTRTPGHPRLPARRPPRPRRGPPRALGRRPVPLARGRRRPRDQGVGGRRTSCSTGSGRAGPGEDSLRVPDRRAAATPASCPLPCGAANGSSSCGAPPSRSTRSCSRWTRTAPSGCSSTRCELDASGLTTLDTWQPTKEGHLLAYQVSEGGTEESVLRVMDVTTGEHVDGPIDRARYSPDRLAARRRVLLLRTSARARARARGRGAVPPTGVAAPRGDRPGRGRPGLRRGPQAHRLLRRLGQSRRAVAAGRQRRRAPRRATTCGSPTCRRLRSSAPTCARCRSTSTPRPGSRSAGTAGCSSSPTGTRPAGGCA